MDKCVRIKKYKFNKYVFNSIDITFIITLEKSDRIKSIIYEIKKFCPTKIVYIVYCKKWKNCKNYLPNKKIVDNSFEDITNTYYKIFKYSKKKILKIY